MESTPKRSAETSTSHIIRCTEVPLELLSDKPKARRYFRSFGRLKTISFKPKIQTCLVEYATEEGVLNALELAGEYGGKTFRVERHNMALLKKKKSKAKDPEWVADPEIQAELEAMGAYSRTTEYNLRPEAMVIDPPLPTVPPVKVPKTRKHTKKPQIDMMKFNQEQKTLISILTQTAFTVDTKYRVLDARDKLLRLRLKMKQETSSKSGATVGTCPDMCPEKERLLRVIQHQVSLYEQDEERGLDPKLAVKQYSRSSADQDSPLPHELRPVEVLRMTMGYLMHRIIGLCDSPDVNLSEWYHFLWDRTRGIRKDITQQALCCHGSVELVEQCARFHIFCSARLVAEDPSTFDQKINTENLTKCLQTLKYMYHDLHLKKVSCPNESEFRAYIILLNLNDGNFMWEVQHLHSSIQRSTHVKFALEVYSSLDKNNYVKFFKLVKSTTFLNACILMRYFTQVRLGALDTFLKCYSLRGFQTSLPLSDFHEILAFESTESTVDFLECHGIKVNEDRTHLVLGRSKFPEAEYAYVLDRAIRVVESKRTLDIGEIICGGPLPPPTHDDHKVQNSFDHRGSLKFDVYLTEQDLDSLASEASEMDDDILFDYAPTPPSSPPRVATPPPPKKVATFSPPKFTFKPPVATVPPSLPPPPKFVAPPPKPPSPPPRVLVDLEEENRLKRQEEIRKRLEEVERLERLRAELLEKQRLLEAKQREESNRLRKVREERLKEAEIRQGVGEVVAKLLDATEKRIKSETLRRIKSTIEKRRAKKALDKWRLQTRLKRKRKAIDFNPVWYNGPSDLQDEADELKLSNQELSLGFMKRYKTGTAIDLDLNRVLDDVDNTVNFFPIPCDVLIGRLVDITKVIPSDIYWKVTFSLSANCGRIEAALDRLIEWKMVRDSRRCNGIIAKYYMEKVKGAYSPPNCDSHGLIFVGEDLDQDLLGRIGSTLKNCGVFCRKPIVLILRHYSENKSKLKILQNEGIVSDYLILVDILTKSNLESLIMEALVFLASRLEKPPNLHMDTLRGILVKYLVEDLWKRASSFSKWNSIYRECLKNPNTTIYLHNGALDRLKLILLDGTLKDYPKFPAVFRDSVQLPESLPCDYKFFPNFYDDAAYLRHLGVILNSLYLPKVTVWPPESKESLESTIYDYCTRVYTKNPERVFYKLMGVLLKDLDVDNDFDLITNHSWIDLIEILVYELIDSTDFSLYGTGFVHTSRYEQLIAVYKDDSLKTFLQSDWFYVNDPVIKATITDLIQEDSREDSPSSKNDEGVVDICEFNLDRTLELLERKRIDFKPIEDKLKQCNVLMEDLADSFVIHKKILEKSGQMLENFVKDE